MYIWFFAGRIIYEITGDREAAYNWAIIISYSFVAVVYGLAWIEYWRSVNKRGIKWFYSRIIVSLIPFIIVLVRFNPKPDPMAMINFPPEPMFSSLVTAIILTPIYSLLIDRFILKAKEHKARNTILIYLITLIIGGIIFAISWNVMWIFY